MAAAAASSTQAGPSSAPLTMRPLQSFRQLYDALEATSATASKQVVHTCLQQLLPALKSACQPLPRQSAASRAKVESGSVHDVEGRTVELDSALRECCLDCSALLDADEQVVARCMRTFLDTEDVSHEKLVRASDLLFSPATGSGSSSRRAAQQHKRAKAASKQQVTSSFVEAFAVYFLEEQLYKRRCISALLRISDDQFHHFHNIAQAALDGFADDAFGSNCLQLAEELAKEALGDTIRDNSRYSTYWAKHRVCEQLVLLEVAFLLHYSRLESSAQFVREVLKLIKTTNFGNAQANAGFFDSEAAQLVDCLVGMQILLAVESLDVENVISGLDFYAAPKLKQRDATHILDAADVFQEAVAYLRSSTARDTLRAPLMVLWALYLCRIDEAAKDWSEARGAEPLPSHLQKIISAMHSQGGIAAVWTEFASVAMSRDVDMFGTMHGITHCALFRSSTHSSALLATCMSSSLALRAVLKGFVLAITEVIRPEFIEAFDGLVTLWEDTFSTDITPGQSIRAASDSNAALCAQFWEIDFEYEQRRSTLMTATRRFPVQFCNLLRLCRALSGSSPASMQSPEDAVRASAAVFQYLAETNVITHSIPPSTSLSLPFEVADPGDDGCTTYRSTRSIPIFGNALIVPVGTVGRMISQGDSGPVVMSWEMEDNPISIWRLLRDVLAKFAGMLESADNVGRKRERGDASVFVDDSAPASFALLAAGEDPGRDADAAHIGMDLISSLLCTSPSVAEALLAHLQGVDIEYASKAQPRALSGNTPPGLESIAMGVLSQALASPGPASPVIISAYRMLSLLAGASINDLWLSLRSSGALVGRVSGLSLLGSKSYPTNDLSSLLSYEISIGKFAGLIALLDFQVALLIDLQTKLAKTTSTDMQIKVEVVMRALRFVCEAVWPEYQSWKYVRVQQRIEIGSRCLKIFHRVITDKVLRRFDSPSKQIALAVEEFLISDTASALAIQPLIEIILCGDNMIHNLSRIGRQVEVELARDLLANALSLATSIIGRRRTIIVAKRSSGQQAVFGQIEKAFFDHSIPQSRSSGEGCLAHSSEELASVVFGYSTAVHHYGVRRAAIKLLTQVAGATVDLGRNPPPALLTHLGSLSNVASIIARAVEQAADQEETVNVRCEIWNLLTALLVAQPGLATLIITGKHVATAGDKHDHDCNRSEDVEKKSEETLAIRLAADVIMTQHEQAPRLTEAALKFLAFAWSHALEHVTTFASLSANQHFWKAIVDVAFRKRDICQTLAGDVEIGESFTRADQEDAVIDAASRDMSSARAMQILSADIALPKARIENGRKTQGESLSLQHLVQALSDSARIASVTQSYMLIPCDAHRHDDTRERLSQTFPEIDLDLFSFDPRHDDFDFDKNFGASYVYDTKELQMRLHPLIFDAQREAEDNEILEGVMTQALLLVASVNLDWSLVDSQTCRLRAFSSLLSTAFGSITRAIEREHALLQKLQSSLSAAWTTGAELTANENIDAPVIRDIHTLRIPLLAILQELIWTLQARQPLAGARLVIVDEITSAVRVVTHPLFSIESAIRAMQSGQDQQFCHDVFRIILVVTRRYERCRHSFDRSREGEAMAFHRMQREIDFLATHTITFAQIFMAESTSNIGSSGNMSNEQVERDGNLQLLLKSIASLTRDGRVPVHVWWPKMQTTAFLETAFDLFSHSPIALLQDDLEPGVMQLSAIEPPLHAFALLDFFLDLASQQSSVEHLVLSGVMTALSTNALSSAFDGERRPTLPLRLSSSSIENALYMQWIRILRIVVSILGTLAPMQSDTFCQNEVTTFFRIYQPFIDACVKRPFVQANQLLLRTNAARLYEARQSSSEVVTLNQLEEAEYVLEMYNHLIRAVPEMGNPRQNDGMGGNHPSVTSFVQYASARLQEAVHLLQHPRELDTLINDRQEGQKLADPSAIDDKRAEWHLLQISASIIATFWQMSDGIGLLCSTDSTEWDTCSLMILPSIGTSLSRPSSAGTLIDLNSIVVETLQSSRVRGNREESKAMTSLLEQSLALASTQLALVMHGRQVSGSGAMLSAESSLLFGEIEAGLGRDISQSIESGRTALQEIASARGDSHPGMEFLDILSKFHKRWNEASDA